MRVPARRALLAVALALAAHQALAAGDYSRREPVRRFVAEMVSRHGFVKRELELVFSRARSQPAVIRAMSSPADAALGSWQSYRSVFVSRERIESGLQFWETNEATLERAARQFGVPRQIVVAILGIETVYGRNTGSYRVIDALATLAFDYPRRAGFFRSELEHFLLFSRDAGLDVLAVKGSYAGAIGIPQFMPGSYRRFGIDYDGDGQTDLSSSAADAIGSVANFLKEHGWERGAPVAFAAQVSGGRFRELVNSGTRPLYRVGELPQFGVTLDGHAAAETPCALIELATPGLPSEFRVALQNFYVLTRYNRSNFYAAAAADLARELAAERRPGETRKP